MTENLRPVERRILAMRTDGISVEEIATRIRRSPSHVRRIIAWTSIPRSGPPERRSPRPIESRVLSLRAGGESHERIGERFGRGPRFIRQVEGLALYQQGLALLS